MTSQVLAKLEDKGCIERTVDPRDTSAKVLRVTPHGVALAERAVEIVEAADTAFFAGIPDTEASSPCSAR